MKICFLAIFFCIGKRLSRMVEVCLVVEQVVLVILYESSI